MIQLNEITRRIKNTRKKISYLISYYRFTRIRGQKTGDR